jgi:hypothetical protein
MRDGYVDKMAEIERFNVNTQRLNQIRLDMALAGNDRNILAILDQKFQVILDENARMSIAPLIEAGQYKNISEGITDMDVELTSGRIVEWMDGQLNRLPPSVQTIVKTGLISKDTAIYKAANKAVQYGDFLAKAILYDHLTKVKGLDSETALRKINEEFVNFSVLPGRTRTGLEGVGATWFMSFKIRTAKVAMSIMREHPVRGLITATTAGDFTGSPINDNLPVVIGQERIGYALGWQMLLDSTELNPFVQLYQWSGEN